MDNALRGPGQACYENHEENSEAVHNRSISALALKCPDALSIRSRTVGRRPGSEFVASRIHFVSSRQTIYPCFNTFYAAQIHLATAGTFSLIRELSQKGSCSSGRVLRKSG